MLNTMRLGWIAAALALLMGAMPAWAGNVTLNFKDADIRAIIEFVAGFSHKNFLVDKRVKGRVTIVSPTPIPEKDAYKVFLSILEVNGYSAVESGDVVKIIPMSEAKQKGGPVASGQVPQAGDMLITHLIPLKHASAQQLVGVLRPLMSPNSFLTAYAPANMLVLSDTASNAEKIARIVRSLDVSEAVGVRLFPLKYASAEKVASTLQRMYQATAAPGRPVAAVRVIAHNPGNVLVVVAPGDVMREISSVVRRLDVKPAQGSGRVWIRYLKNADAEDVSKVIASLISGKASAKNGKPMFAGEVKVVADPATNALLITADPADHKALDALIDKLDIRRLQVLVEALIVEISGSGAQQFGMEFRGMGDFTQPGRRAIGGTTFSNQGGVNIGSVATNPLNPGAGLAVGVVDGTVTFAGKQFLNLGALLRALETKTDVNILSTPNILTMDNEEAEIIVGQNVPFLTGQNATQGGTANPFQTIERKDVGLTLRVTPQISEGDTIRLKIYQEVSSVSPGSSKATGATDIVTNKRSIKTTVLANDGNIIVLGGLIRDDNSTSVQRVPCIGAIPVLGEPFKFTENTTRKTNLMVFLRPHIIRGKGDMDAITEEKYRQIEGIYNRQDYEGTIIFPQKRKPLPKEMNPLRRGAPATGGKGKAPGAGKPTAAPATPGR